MALSIPIMSMFVECHYIECHYTVGYIELEQDLKCHCIVLLFLFKFETVSATWSVDCQIKLGLNHQKVQQDGSYCNFCDISFHSKID